MFQTIHKTLDAVTADGLSRSEMTKALSGLDHVGAHVEERRLALLAGIDALGDSGADAASVGHIVSRRSNRQSKQDAKVATQLAQMPTVAEGLASGVITAEHAAVCAEAAARVSPGEAEELLAMAADLPADRFAKKTREWVNSRESRGTVEKRHARQRRLREVTDWVDGEGMVNILSRLDPINGARALAALREVANQIGPDDSRTAKQRRADAMVALLTGTRATRSGKPHPKHMVHLLHCLDTGSTELADGSPVPAEVLIELGPTAEVVGQVFSGDGRPLWLGRSTRLASRDQWIALIARHRGCGECGATIDRTEAHHTKEWADGGPTNIDNLELPCWSCHGRKHRGRRGDPNRHRKPTLRTPS